MICAGAEQNPSEGHADSPDLAKSSCLWACAPSETACEALQGDVLPLSQLPHVLGVTRAGLPSCTIVLLSKTLGNVSQSAYRCRWCKSERCATPFKPAAGQLAWTS